MDHSATTARHRDLTERSVRDEEFVIVLSVVFSHGVESVFTEVQNDRVSDGFPRLLGEAEGCGADRASFVFHIFIFIFVRCVFHYAITLAQAVALVKNYFCVSTD